MNDSSVLTAKIPSGLPRERERERCAEIILRADADRDADHIFYDDYYLNIFFHHTVDNSVFQKFQIPNENATLIWQSSKGAKIPQILNSLIQKSHPV